MRYIKFIIENFKGIKSAKINLGATPASSIFTLVGLNESGKTTILDAINLWGTGSFDDAIDSPQALELPGYKIVDIRQAIPISLSANFNGNISISAEVEMDDSDYTYIRKSLYDKYRLYSLNLSRVFTISRTYEFSNSELKKTINIWSVELAGLKGRQRNPRKYNAKSEEWQHVVSIIPKRLPSIWYFPNFLLDFPDKIYLDNNPTAPDLHALYRRVIQDVLDSFEEDILLKNHILDRMKSTDDGDKRILDNLLLKVSRKLTKDVFGTWSSIFNRSMEGKELSITPDKDEQGLYYLQFKIKDEDGYYSISERSLGFRWFFGFLLLTTYRGYRKRGKSDVIFMLDEPASNLHSSAQQQLLSSFSKIADKNTIIYTTHSHHLINPLWLESAFVVINNGLTYTKDDANFRAVATDIDIQRYREFSVNHPKQTTYFQPILDALDYTPSNLENIPDVIMVEGKNDYYSLCYFTNIVFSRDDVSFLPGTGSGSLDNVIQLYLGWTRPFIVMLDSDGEGEKQKTRYIDKFGIQLEDKVFTIADINPQWSNISLESIIPEADRIMVQKITYPQDNEYNKKKFNKAIQECLISERELSFTTDTTKHIKKIVDYLSNKLGK